MNPTIPIAIEGDHFVIHLDGPRTVTIPLNRTDQLIALLQARRNNQLRISEPGAPTQWNIDRERAAIDSFCAAQRAANADLSELGLAGYPGTENRN
jgi:hypothetical protein